jgi:transposase
VGGASGSAPNGTDAKKKSLYATEQDSARVQQLRWAYVALLLTIDPHQLVFVDEAGARIDMTRTHGRAPQGLRLVQAVPRNRGRVTTILGALSTVGMVAHMTVDGGTRGEVFERFVLEHLVPVLQPGQVVVWDNLAAHKQRSVRQAIEAKGGQVVFLPPYSPEFNPIEEAWSKLKTLLRKSAARTRQALDEAITAAISRITAADAHGWFGHSGYSLAQPN